MSSEPPFDPWKLYHESSEEQAAVRERAKFRDAMKAEYRKKISNPFKPPFGTLHDPALQRWFSARVTHAEYMQPAPKVGIAIAGTFFLFGAIGLVFQLHREYEAMKERFKEIESDVSKLHEARNNNDDHATNHDYSFDPSLLDESNTSIMSEEEKAEVDLRSIYIGNVDYGSTAEELETHFRGCGPVKRVTILCNHFTGLPKGFAYIEFDTRDSVEAAMALDGSSFRNRLLKVLPKRTNVPGMCVTNRPYGRGRGRGRGMFPMRGYPRMRFPRTRRRGMFYYAPY